MYGKEKVVRTGGGWPEKCGSELVVLELDLGRFFVLFFVFLIVITCK